MNEVGRSTINYIVALFGGLLLAFGVFGLSEGINVLDSFIAVAGLLVVGYAVFDDRRARRGTPESEVEGGRTIE